MEDRGEILIDTSSNVLPVPESEAQPVRGGDEVGRDVLSVPAESESLANCNPEIIPLLKSVAGEWNAHLNRIADSCADIAARLGAIASESMLQSVQHEQDAKHVPIFGRTPPDAALAVAIVRHVRACDPNTLSAKHIRFGLEEEFACNLVTRIDFIRDHIHAVLHDSETCAAPKDDAEIASSAATQVEPSDDDEMVAPFQPLAKRRRADETRIKNENGVGRSGKRVRSSAAAVATVPTKKTIPSQVKSDLVSPYPLNASMSGAAFKGEFLHRR